MKKQVLKTWQIRAVPEELIEKAKKAAKKDRRNLNQWLIMLLERELKDIK